MTRRRKKRRAGNGRPASGHPTANRAATPRAKTTLAIDIGGTGIKMLPLDARGNALSERARELTPDPAVPEAVLGVIHQMLATQPTFDRVSVGFPGVVVRGLVKTAPNLGSDYWENCDLKAAITQMTSKPTRVVNDADLQGYGVITGIGLEMVLTLGTGLGSALFNDGHLVPNLELGHHPYGDKKGRTYEQRVSDEERKRIGKKRFAARVLEMIAQLAPIYNFDRLYIGGGNARRLDPDILPRDVTLFQNVDGLRGGIKLWEDVENGG
jgi:polyphosphate glucokinase